MYGDNMYRKHSGHRVIVTKLDDSIVVGHMIGQSAISVVEGCSKLWIVNDADEDVFVKVDDVRTVENSA